MNKPAYNDWGLEIAPKPTASADADSAAAVARWKAAGGYEGALARREAQVSADSPTACPIHMPFPHKHCGEWR